MIIVQGHLLFDRKDMELDVHYIFVMGGSFIVGTEREPSWRCSSTEAHTAPIFSSYHRLVVILGGR